jgi:anti-anti-sigma factor
MEIRVRDDRLKYVIIDFIGEADVNSMREIQERIEDTFRSKEHRIICNMSEVKHINSSGVNGFLLGAKTVINHGGEIIFSAMQPHVERVFKLGRLDKYLKFFSNLSEAEQYFKSFGKIDTSVEENILILEKKNSYIKSHITRITGKCMDISPIKSYMAKSIDQALRFLRNKNFSLVMMDSTFSFREGKEFIDKILSADGQHNLPILVVMTEDSVENAEYFIRAGAHDVITFPFKPIEVESRLRLLKTLGKQISMA